MYASLKIYFNWPIFSTHPFTKIVLKYFFQKTDNLAGQLNGLTKDQEALLRKIIPIHNKLTKRIRNIYHNHIAIVILLFLHWMATITMVEILISIGISKLPLHTVILFLDRWEFSTLCHPIRTINIYRHRRCIRNKKSRHKWFSFVIKRIQNFCYWRPIG